MLAQDANVLQLRYLVPYSCHHIQLPEVLKHRGSL